MSEEMKNTAAEAAPETAQESMADFEKEIDASFRRLHVGDMVTGSVVSVTEDQVMVDLGTYVGGIIDKQNLSNDPEFNLKEEIHAGDEITATVIKMDDGSGNVVLSRKEANDKLTWEKLREMMNERTMVPVTVLEAVKSGVTAKLEGMRAFIPASRISNTYVEDLNEWVGKTIDVTVIEADEAKKHLVLSGREAARAKEKEAKAAKIAKCEVGSVMEGTVETIKPYGAFVTLDNGLSGLVHISQISRKRIPHPSAVLKEGQKVTVRVINKKDGKLSLSMRETAPEEAPDDQVPAYQNSDALTTTLGDLFKDLKF
ncbi:MAG: S1 RNA-binding domain-containing protein [Clostridium sp.]|nr:S1 RNA-binding domain-containing protein [Clostridium sp.]